MKPGAIRYFAGILLMSLPLIIHAQSPDSNKVKLPGTRYIEQMSNYLAIKLGVNNNINGFQVRGATKTDIQPNDNNSLKLSVNYRWFSFSYSYTPKFFPGNDDSDLKGKTKASMYNFGFIFDHWMQGLTYEKVKGFYLDNTGDYIPGFVEGTDPYIQFPELVYQSYRGQTAYKFNKNFSFNSLSVQTERQLRSTGTLMPVFSYNYYIVDNKVLLTGQNSSQKSNNFEGLLSLSYFYTFVFKENFYLSGGAAAGGGILFTKLLTRLPSGNITTNSNHGIWRFEGFGAAGYNSRRFFIGGQIQLSRESYDQKGKSTTVVVNDRIIYQLFTGYRFNAPKFLKSAVDKTEEKVPIF